MDNTSYHAPISEPGHLKLPRRRGLSFLPFALAIVFSLLVLLVVHLVGLHFNR
jgi:hypothetical protein